MNIWYISKYASPSKYFFGTRHFYLAEEWVKKGNKAVIITSNSSHLTDKLPKFENSWKSENIKGIITIWLNTFKSKSSSGVSRIISWLHFDSKLLLFNKKLLPRPDAIIISSLSLTTLIPAWILSKRYKCKLVFEVRDIWPLSIIILGGYSRTHPFIWLLSRIEKFGYERSHLIVGTMPNLMGHVKNVTSKSARCICIPQGVNLEFYHSEQMALDDEYIETWIPKDKFIVCYAGTINANNPLSGLMKAARQLIQHDIHILILGNGDKKQELMESVKDLSNVSFPPPLHKNQINDFLSRVDICYDSFDSELAKYGLSRNKWIDYMYAGKPIICSYDGFRSMINEADCGTFVPFNDIEKLRNAILYYASMPANEVERVGLRGKEFLVKERRFDKLAESYLEEIVKIE